MLNDLKNLYNLRKQAQELQKRLEAEKITSTSSDGLVSLSLNGSHELVYFKVNGDAKQINTQTLERSFMEAYNKAQNELKNILAQKFQDML